MNDDFIKEANFSEIDLNDNFFDSLRKDYDGFDDWFNRKASQSAVATIVKVDGNIKAFMYLKNEFEENANFIPYFYKKKRMKIGTFKIDSPGTIMGHRFIAYALRKFAFSDNEEVYVTTFSKQEKLIDLLKSFGFEKYGINGKTNEEIYVKNRKYKNENSEKNNFLLNFPFINIKAAKNFAWLAIKANYHSKFFPEVRLRNEDAKIDDCAASNTVLKSYISFIEDTKELSNGDLIYMYRLKNEFDNGYPRYRSVITSIMRVIDSRKISSFLSYKDFEKFVGSGTVFSKNELKSWFNLKKEGIVIKMVYLLPLKKRINLDKLENIYGVSPQYYGYVKLTEKQFVNIFRGAEMNESLIIN